MSTRHDYTRPGAGNGEVAGQSLLPIRPIMSKDFNLQTTLIFCSQTYVLYDCSPYHGESEVGGLIYTEALHLFLTKTM